MPLPEGGFLTVGGFNYATNSVTGDIFYRGARASGFEELSVKLETPRQWAVAMLLPQGYFNCDKDY